MPATVLDANMIVGNEATVGGGLYVATDDATLKNNIIAFNLTGSGVAGDSFGEAAAYSYCCLFGNAPTNGAANLGTILGVRGNFSADPLFVDRMNGDYHLRSAGGRWNPATSTWVPDTVTSPCIDAGDPASAFASEPAPNGGRVNMGSDDNTAQASKTAAPVITVCAPKGAGILTTARITVRFSVPMLPEVSPA